MSHTLYHQKGSFPIRAGETILSAARRSGLSIPQVCGGKGECHTCRFTLMSGSLGEPNDIERAAASKLEGARLSCQCTANGDLDVIFRGPIREKEGSDRTRKSQRRRKLTSNSLLGKFLSTSEHGETLVVPERPNSRGDADRELLLPSQTVIKSNQGQINAHLQNINKSDETEIALGTLQKAPTFGSEEYSDTDYIAARAREKLLYINLEFTNRCNLACKGCFSGFGDVADVFDTEDHAAGAKFEKAVSKPLSLPQLKSIVDQAADLGAKTVDLIGGGEPLISPLFFPLAEHARKRGLEIEVFTNGMSINREKAERLAELEVLPFVKLYSSSSQIHDEMVGRNGSWSRVIAGIDKLCNVGYGDNAKLSASIETIVVKKNAADLANLWRLSREIGFIPYFERFVGCHYDGDPGGLLSPVELKELWEELWLLDRGEYGFTWPMLPLRVGYTCATNFYSLYINYEGEIRPCSGTFIPLGNAHSESLSRVLRRSPVAKDLREFDRGSDSWCAGCYFYESDRCPGCRGMAQAHGSYMGDDPLCFHIPANLSSAADPRNTPHLSKMPVPIVREFPGLHAARESLLRHPIYTALHSERDVQALMETHVFAVWDFMSLAKRLQQDLTNLNLPWVPGKDASLARFINEIIFVEESDEGVDGVPKSHMELYLEAMDEVGASTKQFEGFLSALASGKSVEDALAISEVDPHVTAFIGETMRAALTGSTVEVCASFLYGREDLIPDMFTRFLQARHDKDDYPLFQYYLRRHIEVDGDNHGPAARRMLEKLVDGEMGQWRKAAEAAQRALEARIGLWDGVMRILHRPTPSISFTLHK